MIESKILWTDDEYFNEMFCVWRVSQIVDKTDLEVNRDVLRGDLFKESYLAFMRKPRKTPNALVTRATRFEPGISYVSVLRLEPLRSWWGCFKEEPNVNKFVLYKKPILFCIPKCHPLHTQPSERVFIVRETCMRVHVSPSRSCSWERIAEDARRMTNHMLGQRIVEDF